jgi:hypothetical protein
LTSQKDFKKAMRKARKLNKKVKAARDRRKKRINKWKKTLRVLENRWD